jgi:hypothetical protein
MFLAWALLGALIGVAAAQRKGFSVVGGVIGGLLLGPLAFLMFFVSGIDKSDANRRKCPNCAEWVKGDAKVCKHCHRDLPPPVPIRNADGTGVRPPAVRPEPGARPPARPSSAAR